MRLCFVFTIFCAYFWGLSHCQSQVVIYNYSPHRLEISKSSGEVLKRSLLPKHYFALSESSSGRIKLHVESYSGHTAEILTSFQVNSFSPILIMDEFKGKQRSYLVLEVEQDSFNSLLTLNNQKISPQDLHQLDSAWYWLKSGEEEKVFLLEEGECVFIKVGPGKVKLFSSQNPDLNKLGVFYLSSASGEKNKKLSSYSSVWQNSFVLKASVSQKGYLYIVEFLSEKRRMAFFVDENFSDLGKFIDYVIPWTLFEQKDLYYADKTTSKNWKFKSKYGYFELEYAGNEHFFWKRVYSQQVVTDDLSGSEEYYIWRLNHKDKRALRTNSQSISIAKSDGSLLVDGKVSPSFRAKVKRLRKGLHAIEIYLYKKIIVSSLNK